MPEEAPMTSEQKLYREQFKNDIKSMVANEYGRRFITWILEEGQYGLCSYRGGALSTLVEGMQNLACLVKRAVELHCPEAIKLASQGGVLPDSVTPASIKSASADANNELLF
jgi:hypothetical protein